jgi:sugar transferase (PEP-CTERM/EpsH1 system associated)
MTGTDVPTDSSGPRELAGSGEPFPRPIHVMHLMYRLQAGGMELGVVKVVNGLHPSIASSICSTTPATEVKALVNREVPIYELNRRVGNDPRLIWALYRLFRRTRPDIVHTHAWGTLLEGLLAARLARVPCIVHGEHGTLQLAARQAHAQRWGWGRVDQVLSVSRKLTERMAAATGFPASRILTIQNGVDLTRFASPDRGSARAALGIPPDAVAIGTAGRLVPVKDQANLIEALARLRDHCPNFVGIIAGDGPLRDELAALAAARGLGDRLRLLGHRPDVERVYAALDVFVLPSRSEGMSNTILEAMASGVCVVATRVGGAEELVDDGSTGLLVPREDSAALAEALKCVVSDAQRRSRMGEAARAKAQSEFSLPRMLRDYQTLYVKLADRVRLRRQIRRHAASSA